MVKNLDRIRKVIQVLREFSVVGLRLGDLSEKTSIPTTTLYRTLRWLVNIGVVDIVGGRYKLSPLTASLLSALSDKFDLDFLLSSKYLPILIELREPKTLHELLQVLEISEKTLRKRLSELMIKGVIQKHNETYRLVSDNALIVLINLMNSIRSSIHPHARIIWSKGEERIFSLPRGEEATGIKTAFSRFNELGVQVESPYEYYYYPERELSLEEIIIHSIVAAERDPYKLALTAVLLMKNYDIIDHDRLKQLAVKYGVYDELIKLDLYIHGEEPAEADLLPIKEFEDIARKYGIDIKRFLVKTFSEQMLWDLGRNTPRRVSVFIFGGAAMALKGYKERTKDIDILVSDESTLEAIIEATVKLGYGVQRSQDVAILEHPGKPRIDIYCKHILGKIYLTNTIIARAEKRNYNNLEVLIADDTDIVLTKAVAGRMRDINDIILIMRRGKILWDALFYEIMQQENLSNKHICIRVLNAIELVKEKQKIEVPIYRKLYRVVVDHMTKYAYENLGLRSVKEIQKQFGFPEHAIRRALKKLIQGGS